MESEKIGLGKVLRAVRIANDMSVKDLSALLEVSSAYISEIENGNKQPSLQILKKYRACHIMTSEIFALVEQGAAYEYEYKKLLYDTLCIVIARGEKEYESKNSTRRPGQSTSRTGDGADQSHGADDSNGLGDVCADLGRV